jgi:oligopeptide/dipeptide ABC transporter ATP-binding protein
VPDQPEILLQVTDLEVNFSSSDADVHALRGVSFDLRPHEVLGIVGESGSGKSVTGLAILGLLAKNAVVSGSVSMKGTELLGMNDKGLRQYRGDRIAMIFQDPLTSLNPVYSVGWQIDEALRAHRSLSKDEARRESIRLLEVVGIPQAGNRIDNYPHEFSGGMRQRVVIAIAMANNPDVIIADEPTTALDVTVQAQVLDALERALAQSKSSMILITHDLGVIAGLADRVAVMYAGRIVEIGTAEEVFYQPSMPYTHGLLGAVPRVDNEGAERLHQIPGAPPSMTSLSSGCPFAPRCPLRQSRCLQEEPELRLIGTPTSPTHVSDPAAPASAHMAACHFADQVIAMPVASMFTDTSADPEEMLQS